MSLGSKFAIIFLALLVLVFFVEDPDDQAYEVTTPKLLFDKTVMITLCNIGYWDIFSNMVISMKQVGLSDYLIVRISEFDLNIIRNDTDKNWAMDMVNFEVHNYRIRSGYAQFGWGFFTAVTTVKVQVTFDYLEKGYDVLFIDSDIFVVKNFREEMKRVVQGLDPKIIGIFQRDDFSKKNDMDIMCTGLYWVRSASARILSVFNVTRDLDRSWTALGANDQVYLNAQLKRREIEFFDRDMFPNGWWVNNVLQSKEQIQEKAYLIHANHEFDKIPFLMKWGGWCRDKYLKETGIIKD